VAGLGGLLLWLLMLRRAGRERRIRDTFYPLLPVVAPVPYLAGLIVVARQSRGVSGVSQGWFLVITSAGLVAAAAAAAGPGLALRRLQPRGQPCAWPPPRPECRRQLWRPPPRHRGGHGRPVHVGRHSAGFHGTPVPWIYLTLVVVATTVTAVSAARGTRAALAEP